MNRSKRVVLAYSGGVDTTACIPYLRHEMNCDYVVAMAVDLGQGEELEYVREKALLAGADVSVVVDAKERFITEFGFAALRANAVYDRQYPLSSALGRPLIGDLLVTTAYEYDCGAVAHGATGKGNDQVRMDLAVQLRDPSLCILAPAREWGFSRAQTIAYSESFGIPAHVSKEKPWAIDLNILGRNVEAGPIEDIRWEPAEEVWAMTRSPEYAPNVAEYVTIDFERGMPVGLDGVGCQPLRLLSELNSMAGRHGVGRIDMLENRIVGVKSRELYEAPAVTVLLTAHADLENLTLPHDVLLHKQSVDATYARLVYEGFWYSPLRSALDAYVASTQEAVSGSITVKLYKGSVTVARRASAHSLYRHDLVTYGDKSSYDQSSATGFIEVFGRSGRVWSEAKRFTGQPAGASEGALA